MCPSLSELFQTKKLTHQWSLEQTSCTFQTWPSKNPVGSIGSTEKLYQGNSSAKDHVGLYVTAFYYVDSFITSTDNNVRICFVFWFFFFFKSKHKLAPLIYPFFAVMKIIGLGKKNHGFLGFVSLLKTTELWDQFWKHR